MVKVHKSPTIDSKIKILQPSQSHITKGLTFLYSWILFFADYCIDCTYLWCIWANFILIGKMNIFYKIALVALSSFALGVSASQVSTSGIAEINLGNYETGTQNTGSGYVVATSSSASVVAKTLVYYCQSGFTLGGSGESSYCLSSKQANYRCPTNTKQQGSFCVTERRECRFDRNNKISRVTSNSSNCGGGSPSYFWNGKEVPFSARGAYTEGVKKKSVSYGTCKGSITTSSFEICGMAVKKQNAAAYCSSGYKLSGTSCIKKTAALKKWV